MHAYGLTHPLHLELAEVLEREVSPHQGGRRRREVARIGRGERLHALRKADGVPLRSVVHAQVVADRADDDLTRVQAHARREADAVLTLHVGGVTRDLVAQLEHRIAGPLRVILVRNRRAEQRHDPIACVLVDRPLEEVHALGQDLEEAVENAVPLLGVELVRQLHRALHVGEQHRHLLALALQGGLRLEDLVGEVLRGVRARVARRRLRGCQRMSTSIAEPLIRGIRPAARRARVLNRKVRGTLSAEARAFAVLVATVWAVHASSSLATRSACPIAPISV